LITWIEKEGLLIVEKKQKEGKEKEKKKKKRRDLIKQVPVKSSK
jgi:hypothetical protein